MDRAVHPPCASCVHLRLEAIDTLFFRDGRPFEASSRASTGLPMPQTLAGAVRTFLLERASIDIVTLVQHIRAGASFEEAAGECGPQAAAIAAVRMRGPWFMRHGEVLAPMPANLRAEKESGCLVRLDPLAEAPQGWEPAMPGMLPLWRRGRGALEAVEGFLNAAGLKQFLEGHAPDREQIVPSDQVYLFDDRTGISIDDGRGVTRDGIIYTVRLLALHDGVSLHAEVSGAPEALAPLQGGGILMRLGGEGRSVAVHAETLHAVWPSVPADPVRGRMLLLTTPAWFGGWKPEALSPVAASVGGYLAVSGWDLATGGPKPNRFMVPAGSIYFLPPGVVAPEGDLVGADDAAAGWGCFVEGNWSHA